MSRRTIRIALVLALSAGAPGLCPAGALLAGAARERITPQAGMPMAGYYSERLAEGTHDDLFASAVYISDGENEIAWVVCDLLAVDRRTVREARRLIHESTGIPPENVMISATHTHTGPRYFGPHPGVYAAKPEELAPRQRAYVEKLCRAIARSVAKARKSARPARIKVATAVERSLSFNRRYWMKDGKVRTNPGKRNPQIVRPAGPIDPLVVVLGLFDKGSSVPFASVVNFALHCDTVGGKRFSAGYPYFLYERLRRAFGPGHVTLFAQGCCGDINHIDVATTAPQKGFDEARRIGRRLGGDVLAALDRAWPAGDGPVGAHLVRVRLPLQSFRADEIAWARSLIERRKRFSLELVRAYKLLALEQIGENVLETDVQAFRIGNVALVALPGEIFVELGLSVRRRSPFPITLVVELANGSIGYVPTRKAFKEGGYEVTNSLVAPGAGEKLAAKAVELLDRLNRLD